VPLPLRALRHHSGSSRRFPEPLEASPPATALVAGWLARHELGEPASVLGAWHLPLSAEALADFARTFPHLRYEVRVPTLDDLFLKLALEP